MIKPVMQKYLHDPKNKVHGDCWRACISSITSIDIDLLPDPNDYGYDEWSKYWVSVWQFLQDNGFDLCVCNVPNYKGNGIPVIASGKSPRGDFNHAVVWENGIIHDPHPEGGGIHSILMFETIDKIIKECRDVDFEKEPNKCEYYPKCDNCTLFR